MTLPEHLTTALADRYLLEREIGRGGMATVYLARDLRHDRAVALKVLDPELGAVLGIDRFLAEIRVTANLHHPNLLPLFDSGEASHQPFYVMPYVEGESLRRRIEREKQLPVDEAVRIAVAVAGALEYAHAHGVIHRDLKPENILLQSGHPVVADFGIALAVSNAGGARITQTGLSLGTPQYMSPEQASGDRAIDGRSDVYSLAAMTYEMLTGDPPHSGSTMQAVIARVLTERPRSVRTVRPSVPEYVADAVERGLEKLPADRWISAGEFADALQGRAVTRSARSDPLSLAATGEHRPTAALARARDPVVIGALVLAAAGAASGVWSWRRAPSSEHGVTVRFAIAPASAGEEIPPVTQLTISNDGKLIAYVVRDQSGEHLAVRDVGQLSARMIPGTGGVSVPAFSPDGAWLAFVTRGGGSLNKVSPLGGPVLTIAQGSNFRGVAWAGADRIIASVRDTLMIVPAVGGTFQPVTRNDGDVQTDRGQRGPRVLADGTTVLYESYRRGLADSKIGVLSLATGKTDILDVDGAFPIGVIDGHLIYATSTGVIMAVPFEVASHRVTGTAVPVIEQVDINPYYARAALSPSGSLAYISGARNTDVVVADMAGRVQVLIGEARNYGSPRFSPDGTKLALSITTGSGSDIWIDDIASATLTKLTSDGEQNIRPEWTPDGKRVLYTSNRKGQNALWWQNADLSGMPELVESAPGTDNGGVISPDGRALLYWLAKAAYPADILYRQLAGDTTPKPIAATQFGEISPRFSPDGKWVVYASNQDGTLKVYVQPFPPTGARYQVTATGGMAPVWSRDGSRIFYVSGGRLNAATVRTSPTFAVLSRAPMFEGDYLLNLPLHANYDVSPDSKHLVLLRSVGPTDQIVVVHDWKYELRERTRSTPAK